MKLLFGGQGAIGLSGGMIMVALLMRAAQEQGHDVLTLTAEPAPEWWPDELPVRVGGFGDLEAPDDPASFDAVVTGLEAVEAALAAGFPVVVQLCAGFEPDLWPEARARFEGMYRQPTLKAVIAPHIQRSIEREFGLRSEVIGSPLDLSSFSPASGHAGAAPAGAGDRPLRVLTVGPEPTEGYAPVPFKGIANVLEIMRRVRERGHELELVRLTPYADSLNDSEQLDEVHVGVEPARVPEIYRSCDVYLGASTAAEGLGMPPFEAACSGLASVIPAIPSYLDVPALERCALLYPPGNLDQAAAELERLSEDRALLARLAAAGPRCGFRELFDPAAVATRLVAAIERYRGDPDRG